MAAKEKTYPDFLLEGADKLFPGEKRCVWYCGCGAPYFFKRSGEKHGGPLWRVEGHPEWAPGEGACWRARAYKVKCTTPKGVRVLTHEGYDPPTEADLARYTTSARGQRRKYKEAVYEYDQEKRLFWWCP